MDEATRLSQDEIARLSGLDQLHGIIEGRLPSPTMMETLAFRLVEVAKGQAVFEGAPTAAMLNPLGTVHGGWAAAVLDSALGCAVLTTLAPGERFATLELKVNLTRTLLPGMAALRATGTLVTRGRRTAVSEARLVDAEGRICAHGTSTCLITPPEATPG